VVATDFWRGAEVVIEEGKVLHAVRASMSIPGLVHPSEADGKVLVDGGLVNVLPYEHLRDRCDVTIGIDVSGERNSEQKGHVPSSLEVSAGAVEILQNALLQVRLRESSPDLLVKPALRNIGLLDFGKAPDIRAQCEPSWEAFPVQLARLGLVSSRLDP
jgi:NTE family protein